MGYLCSGISSVVQQTYAPAVSEVTPPHMRVRAFALIDATVAAGIMVAGFVSGALYEISPPLPLQVGIAGGALAIVATLLVRRELLRWQEAGSGMPGTARDGVA